MNTLLSLALLALAAAPPAAALDALDFDNGAILLSETGSYGDGVGSWSAWRLTDGDEAMGWCSPAEEITGGTFVWELDTTWRLDTFVLSTANVQEDGYPGISARSVDLFVSPDGAAWQKLGGFEIARLTRKAFPLPKGTQARQVKLVVTGNHGHKEYTEIAELDLLGARVGAVATAQLGGDFATNYGPMRFVQDGEALFGCYDWAAVTSAVWGSVSGRIARVVWFEASEGSTREGTATFAVKGSGELWGIWYEGGELKGIWEGPRAPKDEGPTCTPRREGQLGAMLKKKGRAVLYGIHFAVNADVPLPESEPTLVELAGALKADPAVKVLIEGHTDSTNTDAYNLGLSARRAKSVMGWLTKHGVEPKRLQAKGFGKARPVADNATAQGRALNRRVEVSVVK
ncbi:MAG TPA: OmpA family protein [Myxococcota bacterium]|nr:OmpA family protein [Myxococcota bacterium]HRY95795.1 OmpA family protein [Myxococcota bacterium]HSA21164.1 OmpA family protein [Myxococcota bacterium]